MVLISFSARILFFGGVSRIALCADDFHVLVKDAAAFSAQRENQQHCLVRTPEGYKFPYRQSDGGLWSIPRANVGRLDTSDPEYYLHVNRQRWVAVGEVNLTMKVQGGTSVRNFKSNFDYVHLILNHTEQTTRCGVEAAPTMLDMGAGIGSVGAALADPGCGNRAIRTLSYVFPERYLRLGVIMSDRGLPYFLANFTGSRLPFPSSSFDFVHCRWCWHHVAGYDAWLTEVYRLLVPGGYFVFTFVKPGDPLLEHPHWEDSVARQSWTCNRFKRITIICRKAIDPRSPSKSNDFCPFGFRNSTTALKLGATERIVAGVNTMKSLTSRKDPTQRILNINCPSAVLCSRLEAEFYSDSIMHVSNPSEKAELGDLLLLRKLGIVHKWPHVAPFYPRSFDVINIGCTSRATHALLSKRVFFIELHRLLRPNGLVLILRSFCDFGHKVEGLLTQTAFAVLSKTEDILIAQRLDSF